MIVFFDRDFSDYPKNIIKLPNNKSWSINDSIDEIKLSETELNLNAIPSNTDETVVRILVLPFHRFSLNYHTILLENKSYTINELLNIIYDFYNKKRLSYLDLKSINSDDVYDYINDQCIELINNPNTIVNPIHIMGEKIFFQGIYYEEDNIGDIQYTLSLGS